MAHVHSEVKVANEHAPPDLVLLHEIAEHTILECLKQRHKDDAIYTYIGPVLVSVNPFKNMDKIYTKKYLRAYQGRMLYEEEPHIYALA